MSEMGRVIFAFTVTFSVALAAYYGMSWFLKAH
jgi:hypothetical protein